MSFGEGASPYLYEDKIFIQWDHEGDSHIYALDTKTGDEIWSKPRNVGTSWATPLVVEVNGKPQLIACATNSIISYDANTGDVIWTCAGLTDNDIPNPKYVDGILYAISGFRGNKGLAIDISKAKGDITGSDAIVWSIDSDCPYTPDNMILNGRMYFLRANNGELTCVDTKTGEVKYSKARLEGISDLYSSPTGVGDKIYIASDGICLVVKAGDTYELLSSNKLEDDFHASPVVVGNKLLLKGFHSLYCFEE
jgi:outer membrane protein assembly factor BamB